MTTPYIYDTRAAAMLAQIVADAPRAVLEPPRKRPDMVTLFLGKVRASLIESGFDAQLDDTLRGVVSVVISPLFNPKPARMAISPRDGAWYIDLLDNTGRQICPTQGILGFPDSINGLEHAEPATAEEVAAGLQAMTHVSKVTEHFVLWVHQNLKRDFPPVTETVKLARAAAERMNLRDSFRDQIIRRAPDDRS